MKNCGQTNLPLHHKPRRIHLAIWFLMGGLLLLTVVGLVLFELQLQRLAAPAGDRFDYARRYAFVGDKSSAFLQEVCSAAAEEGRLSGDYVGFIGEDLDMNYTELQLFDIAVAAKADGIIVNADDSDAMREAIGRAEKAGIPVVCIGTDSYGSLRQSYVGISYYTLGQEYGKAIAALASDEVQNVLILTSPNEKSRGQNLVFSGIRDYIAKAGRAGRFTFETLSVGNGAMFSAAESITDLFGGSSLPEIIVCLDETNTTCACQAIVDTNHVGDVTILGYYVNDTICNAIEKQIIPATLTVNAEEIGRSAVRCLDEYLSTGFVTEYVSIDIRTLGADSIGDYLSQRAAAEESAGKEVSE